MHRFWKFPLRQLVFSGMLLGLGATAHAQLADTIWEGKVTVSGFSLQPCIDGVPKPDLTFFGLKFQLPFEVWFLDGSNLLVVGRRDKMGGNPENQKYALLFGVFPGLENGGSHMAVGTYRPTSKAGTYTFDCSRTRLSPPSSPTSSYQGARIASNGSFRLSGNKLILVRPVFSFSPNPQGATKPKILGTPKFAFTQLAKTSRTPSVELIGWEE